MKIPTVTFDITVLLPCCFCRQADSISYLLNSLSAQGHELLHHFLSCNRARLKEWMHQGVDQADSLVRLVREQIGDEVLEHGAVRQRCAVLMQLPEGVLLIQRDVPIVPVFDLGIGDRHPSEEEVEEDDTD